MASLSNPTANGAGTKAATGLVLTEAASVFIEPGHFAVEVSGGATATWKVVRTTDDPADTPTFHDFEDYLGAVSNSANRVLLGYEAVGAYYNVNVTAYTSGTLAANIKQNRARP